MNDDFEPERPLSFYDMRKRVLESSMRIDPEENGECSSIERGSQAGLIRRWLVEQAERKCKAEDYKPDTDESWEVYGQAGDIGDSLTWPKYYVCNVPFGEDQRGLSQEIATDAFRLTNGSHPNQLIADARNGKSLNIDKDEFEAAVGQYLKSELRDTRVDRLILMTLIDIEITHYLKQVFWSHPLSSKSAFENYQNSKSPISNYVYSTLWRGFLAILISGAAIGTSLLFDEAYFTAAAWTATVTLSLWAAASVLGLILLPRVVTNSRQNRDQLKETFERIPTEMVKIYNERWTDGPLSLRRVRSLLECSAITWPSAMWPLLDDLEERGVKML